jgi:hypothetical protein
LLSDTVVRIVLAPDTKSEQALSPDAKMLKDALLLEHRGYLNLSYMHEIDQNGGSFIRGKTGMNPWVLDAWREDERMSSAHGVFAIKPSARSVAAYLENRLWISRSGGTWMGYRRSFA